MTQQNVYIVLAEYLEGLLDTEEEKYWLLQLVEDME